MISRFQTHLLAKLLETIATAKPIAIGLDIYRDVAVPRDGSQLAELNRVFQENQNIVGIFKFGDPEHPVKVAFPPALANASERYGFNDFPVELGAVRRGFLFLWDAQDRVYPSFALALASQAGIATRQEGSKFHIGKANLARFRSNDGAYIRAQDGGHQFLLDFKSPRKFPTYSLDDVLSNRVNEQAWRGKIVLIGEGAESAHDFETTPLQQSAPGVELHAQTLNQLLRAAERGDSPTTAWPESAEVEWILVWCILGGAIGFFIRRPLMLLAVCCALGGALVRNLLDCVCPRFLASVRTGARWQSRGSRNCRWLHALSRAPGSRESHATVFAECLSSHCRVDMGASRGIYGGAPATSAKACSHGAFH